MASHTLAECMYFSSFTRPSKGAVQRALVCVLCRGGHGTLYVDKVLVEVCQPGLPLYQVYMLFSKRVAPWRVAHFQRVFFFSMCVLSRLMHILLNICGGIRIELYDFLTKPSTQAKCFGVTHM